MSEGDKLLGEKLMENNNTEQQAKTVHYKRHHDDEIYDEINIKLVERWKTSGLSGDEWRFSAVIQFKRKGLLLAEERFSKMEYAVAALPYLFMSLGEQGKLNEVALQAARTLCAQPGCSEQPTNEYRLKKRYCRDGHPSDASTPWGEDRIRFCSKHKRRGDCGLQDSDENYEEVEMIISKENKMNEERIPTSQKLAEAMKEAGCPEEIIKKAASGYYDDFTSPLDTPCIQLVNDLKDFPLLRERAKCGEFDAQKWESDEWANSPAGAQAIKDFPPEFQEKLFGVVTGKTQ